MYMGYIFESQKEFDKSMLMFRKAVELNLDVKKKKTSLIKIMLYYSYHQSWNIIVHYANKYLRLDPNNKEVLKMRDRAYANQGRDPGQIPLLTTDDSGRQKKNQDTPAEKSEPVKEAAREKSAEKSSEEAAPAKYDSEEERLWDLSLKYFKEEDFTKADRVMQELVRLKPKNKNYLYKAGIAKLRLGEFERSVKLFQSSRNNTKESDSTLRYYLNLNEAQSQYKLGNNKKAIALYKKAYAMNNSTAPAVGLAKLYFEQFKYDECIKYAEKLLKLEANNLDGLMYKAVALLYQGKRYEGNKILMIFAQKLNASYPGLKNIPEKYHEGIMNLGFFYSGRVKYKLAIKYLNVVANSKSDSPRFLFAIAKTQFYTGKQEEAVDSLEKLTKIPAANFLLSKHYAKTGNIEKAKEYLGKAAAGNSIYWVRVKLDAYFKESLKNPDFLAYVDNRGLVEEKKPGEKEEPPAAKKDSPESKTTIMQPEVNPVQSNTTPVMPAASDDKTDKAKTVPPVSNESPDKN